MHFPKLICNFCLSHLRWIFFPFAFVPSWCYPDLYIGFCGLLYPCYIIACLDSLFSYVSKLKLQKMLAIQVELMGVLNLKNLLKSQRDLAYLRYPNPLLTSVLRTSSSRGRTHLLCQEMLDLSDGLLTH